MHVRPHVETTPDMARHPVLAREIDELWYLNAVRIEAMPAAVDHAGANDDATHAVARAHEDRPVNCDAHHPFGHWLERAVFVENRCAVLAGRAVGENARAARLNEYLAGAGERAHQRLG